MSNILICITGSIAAIKLPHLIHRLTEKSYTCKVIISSDGLNFVTEMAISSMGADIYLDDNINTQSYSQVMQHINLGRWADYILICPASANSIAKLSQGSADNLLSATVLASAANKIIVPAMNCLMWKNSLTQQNISILQQHGFTLWGPVDGLQACGDNDIGRMLEVEEILERIDALVNPPFPDLAGKHIVITAGGTKEKIDPVRYISNYSSGKMGHALAQRAVDLGARVTLISASDLPAPLGVHVIPVSSGEDLLRASLEMAAGADIFIGAAAVCDYMLEQCPTQKIKKSERLSLNLVPTPDILKVLRSQYPKLFIVGFAAETNNLLEHARAKLISKKLNLIVANDVSNNQVFNQDTNQVIVIKQDFSQFASTKDTKAMIARFILQHIFDEYMEQSALPSN